MMNSFKNFTIEDNIIKGVERPIKYKNNRISKIILDALNANPNHVSEIDVKTGKSSTMQDLKNNSIRLALWLQKQGVKPGDAVTLCEANHPYVSSIVFAILYINAIHNPWDHELDIVKGRHFMKMMKPKVIFCSNDNIDIILESAKLENQKPIIVAIDESSEMLHVKTIIDSQSQDEVDNFKPVEIENMDDICFVAFTSGTTSMSKGVARTYDTTLKMIVDDLSETAENQITLTHYYPSWDIHFWCMIAATVSKCTTIIQRRFDDAETCKIIEKYKVNILMLHTYQLMRINGENADQKYNFHSLKEVIPAGTSVPKNVIESTEKLMPNAMLLRNMGTTEAGDISVYTKECKNLLSSGHVKANVQVKIVDTDTRKRLGCNKEGELCVKTSEMMDEYYKDPEATKECFDDEGFYLCGDRAYYDENGELVVFGRIKEIIKYRYYDIYPWNIEEVLLSHPEVTEVAVVPVPNSLDFERPLAFVKTVPGSKVTEEELIKLTEPLDYQKLQTGEICFLEDMPRSSNGKIMKRVLKKKASEMIA